MTKTTELLEAVRPTAIDELLPPPKDSQSIMRLGNYAAVGETVLIRHDNKTKAGIVSEWFTGPGFPRRMSIQVMLISPGASFYTVSFFANEAEAHEYADLVEKLDTMRNPKIFNRGWSYGTVVAWPRPSVVGQFNTNQEVWRSK